VGDGYALRTAPVAADARSKAGASRDHRTRRPYRARLHDRRPRTPITGFPSRRLTHKPGGLAALLTLAAHRLETRVAQQRPILVTGGVGRRQELVSVENRVGARVHREHLGLAREIGAPGAQA